MLESAVYLGMKNDLAFIIDMKPYLMEHQFTVNPNMPLTIQVNKALESYQGALFTYCR